MNLRTLVVAPAALASLLAAGCAQQSTVRTSAPDVPLNYPPAHTVEVVDDYHGTQVADPYRWMEEYTPDTNAWIDAQEALARAYLDAIPGRDEIRSTLTKLWNFERFTAPTVAGKNFFYGRNDGLQNQSVLYVTSSLRENGRVLLDPNTMSKDGTVALAGTSPNDEGTLLGYATAEAGSDWNVIRVRDVATGKDLADELRWVKFSPISWTKDGKGFFYARFDAPEGDKLKAVNEFQKIYFHAIGTSQSDDRLVFERKDQPRWYVSPVVSDDGRYLVVYVERGDSSNNALFYKDLSQAEKIFDNTFVELFNAFDARYTYLGNDGTTFFIQSNREHPRSAIWAVDIAKPEFANWKLVVPETADALESASIVGDRLFCNYLRDARSVVHVYSIAKGSLGKRLADVPLPGICTAAGFGGRRSDTQTFFSTSSFTLPPTIWRYDLASGATEIWRAPKVPFDGSKYETTQSFATSKDGTKVPMFITKRKGLTLDGSHPTLLYGYGGFNVALTPDYSPVQAAWLEMGGVYVEANLRGGSEYGEDWHKGGMRLTKQNTFDDFIACGEWLIANKYTSTPKLAIQGGSNGGLLVGAALIQRPDLWGACLPAVGVLDMLRFHKFTVGWGWIGDYGSSEIAEDFKVLYSYSPYHNIKQGVCYPPTLITTGDHDDRVHPAHSFKFGAALQAAQAQVPGCTNPILVRIDKRAGHGAGKPTSKRIDEATDVFAFLRKSLGMGN
ncbi:MAG: S9 family peptidase [Phycisphaerae bacterium]|nr:S9 family peptidase [Phycisphaerae bacterium]